MMQGHNRGFDYDSIGERLKDFGWKKHAFLFYRLAENTDHIISANLKKDNKSKDLDCIVLELHSAKLNAISHFMWDYGRQYHGNYRPPKLSIKDQLTSYKACSLFATQLSIKATGRNLEKLPAQCLLESDRLSSNFPDTSSLIELYKDNGHFIGPLLCMYIDQHDYSSARKLLEIDGFDEQGGAGDVRFGVYLFLNENNLL